MRRTADGSVTSAVTAKAQPPSGADRGGHRVGLLGAGPGVDGHRKTLCRKAFGDDRSQTAARPGHQGDLWCGVSHRQARSARAAPRRRRARRTASRWPAVARCARLRAPGRPARGTSRRARRRRAGPTECRGFRAPGAASDRPDASVISTSASCLPSAGSATTFTRSRRSTTSGRVRIACDSSSVPTRRKIAAAAAQWRRLNFACMRRGRLRLIGEACRRCGDPDVDHGDVAWCDIVLGHQRDHAVDHGVGERTARVELVAVVGEVPGLAEPRADLLGRRVGAHHREVAEVALERLGPGGQLVARQGSPPAHRPSRPCPDACS